MEDKKEVRKGSFVWKIDFLELVNEEIVKSPVFKFGKYDCFLDIWRAEDTNCYRVTLWDSKVISTNYKTFCKLCLIDGSGDEFLVTHRTTQNFDNNGVPFMTIWHHELRCKENDLLPEDVLTLRLSWCDAAGSASKRYTQVASDLDSKKEPIGLFQTLSGDFGRFYESKEDTDFFLKICDASIPVHRAMLSARSEAFKVMLRLDTSKNGSAVVDIPGVDAVVFSDALYFVYSGQIRGLSADTAFPMYLVAEKYSLIELKCACLDVLMHNLTVENVCDVAQLAQTHKETHLEEKVVQFVKEKIEEIEETDKWKELLKSEFTLVVKLLRSALNIYKYEVKYLSSKRDFSTYSS